MPPQIVVKLADLLRSSSALRPAFLAYEQAVGRKKMQWRELVDLVGQCVEDERGRRMNDFARQPAKNGQQRGKPTEPAAPAIVANPTHQAILDKFPGYCWKHLTGDCSYGARCRFSHAVLSNADAIALHAARQAQGGADNAGDVSPARAGAVKKQDGICHAFADGRVCPRMPNCPYKHGDTPEEVARVAAVQASAKGKGKGKAGVGSQSSSA